MAGLLLSMAGAGERVAGYAAQMHWGGDRMDWGWGGWLLMSLGMLAFWVVVAVLIVWLVRASSSSQRQPPSASTSPSQSPLDIARERYARGEITDEEFQRIKRGLAG